MSNISCSKSFFISENLLVPRPKSQLDCLDKATGTVFLKTPWKILLCVQDLESLSYLRDFQSQQLTF